MPTMLCRAVAVALIGIVPVSGCAISPEPLSEVELSQQGSARLHAVAVARTPVQGTLTLRSAISRAVQYNLDHRVELFQTALRQAELGVASASMLPTLAAGASAGNRNNTLASSSFNLVTNVPNFGFSTSQDEHLRAADLQLSWNVLDFGLSYVRARQAADKVLIANETRRRVVQKLVSDVRTAYWRAYAADQLRDRLRHLESRASAALARSYRQVEDGQTSPIVAITYRRELIEIRRALQELQRELVSARIQLAALINERPDAKFRIAPPNGAVADKFDRMPVSALVAMAVEKRPELREVSYRRRINEHEAHAALIELLPGLSPFVGANYDSNSFLLHDQWVGWGVKASWNVMRLFQYPRRREQIELQDELLAQRDLALTLAVMTQIHVGRARVAIMKRELQTARAYDNTQRELLGHLRAEFASGKISAQTVLREELNGAVGQLRRQLAEANLQGAYAELAAAAGIDPPGSSLDVMDLLGIDEFRTRIYSASYEPRRL